MADLKEIAASHSADESLANAGAELDFGEFKLFVARWGNRKFETHWRKILDRPDVRRKFERDLLKPEEDRALADEVIAHTVIVGWSNIQEDGKDLPYSPEKALVLLKMEFLREEVIRFAKDNANYRAQRMADGIDVLKKSSSGT